MRIKRGVSLFIFLALAIFVTVFFRPTPVQAENTKSQKGIFFIRAVRETPVYHIIGLPEGPLITAVTEIRGVLFDPAYVNTILPVDDTVTVGKRSWYHIAPKPWFDQRFTNLPLLALFRNMYVPTDYFEVISAEEIAPIDQQVDPTQKWIAIDLSQQQLTAYVGNQPVFVSPITTGLKPGWTPEGSFNVCRKSLSWQMQGWDFDTVGVSYVVYIDCRKGIAMHSAPWQKLPFGVPRSHGCIRLPEETARWIFRWTTPTFTNDGVHQVIWATKNNPGTLVIIHSGDLTPPGLMLQTKLKFLR